MFQGELVRGQLYRVRLTDGSWHDARFISERVYNPVFNANRLHDRRSTTHYLFQNIDSGRDVEIKSRVRIKSKVF